MNHRWIAVVFWIVFLSALGLFSRYPWLQANWPAMLLLAVGGLAINYLVQVIRGRPTQSCGSSRWWTRFLLEHESERPKRP